MAGRQRLAVTGSFAARVIAPVAVGVQLVIHVDDSSKEVGTERFEDFRQDLGLLRSDSSPMGSSSAPRIPSSSPAGEQSRACLISALTNSHWTVWVARARCPARERNSSATRVITSTRGKVRTVSTIPPNVNEQALYVATGTARRPECLGGPTPSGRTGRCAGGLPAD